MNGSPPSLFVFCTTLALVSAVGCGDVTANAIGDPNAANGDGGIVGDGAITDGSVGDVSTFCQGSGPSIPIPTGGRCVGDLGPKLFRFAVCACTGGQVSGTFRTDSFKSGGGGAASDVASIAANGSIATNSHATIGGSVYGGGVALATGQPAVSLSADGTIARDVRAGGDVVVNGVFQVSGDLYTSGDVKIMSGSLATVGKVHVAPGHSAAGVTAGGGVVTESVTVVPPCDCTDKIDVAAIAAAFATSNDNAMANVTTTALDYPAGAVKLDCGRYYFDRIAGGDVTLHVTGRAGIFIGGDLKVTGALTIDLSPGAEVDLFIAGNFSLNGPAMLGSVSAPAKVRVYVGGTTMDISGNVSVGANLYAPNADLAIASSFEMSGAVYAHRLAFSGDFAIHYDESILDVTGCAPTGGGCKTCNDCAGKTPACKGGACVGCTTTADCCAPLVCQAQSGQCVLSIR